MQSISARRKRQICERWSSRSSNNTRPKRNAKGYPNDLALALVSCIGLNSHVYSGKTEKPLLPFEQNVGRRDAIAEYATDNGTFAKLSDAEKQELYELFIILGGLTYHYYDKAQKENNEADIKSTREMAAHNLKLLGVR